MKRTNNNKAITTLTTAIVATTILTTSATLTANDSPYRYAIIRIPSLNGSEFEIVRALNDHGHAVGSIDIVDGTWHPFFWDGSTIIDLGTLGGRTGMAWDINNHDVVVGQADDNADEDQAFVWNNGQLKKLGEGVLWLGRAYAINDNHQIAGEGGPIGEDIGHPVLWDNGETIILPEFDSERGGGEVRSINDNGAMAGTSWSGTNNQATIWQNGEFKILGSLGDGTDRSHVWGMNNHDIIVGQSHGVGPADPWYGTVWTSDGKIHNVNRQEHNFSARLSSVRGINDRGAFIGGATSRKHDQYQPYLYTPERGYEPFMDLTPPHHQWDFDFYLGGVRDINKHDQIVGRLDLVLRDGQAASGSYG